MLSGELVGVKELSGEIGKDVVRTGSGGTTNYNNLANKPQINGVELRGNKTSAELGITSPTKLSELQNDTGFITADEIPEIPNENELVKKTDVTIIDGTTAPTTSTVADYIGQMYRYGGQIYVCTDIRGEETKTYTWEIGGVGKSSIGRFGVIGLYGGINSIAFNQSGFIYTPDPNNTQISNRQTLRMLSCSKIDYAFKVAMTDGKGEAWTDDEKLGAWKRLTIIKTEIDDVLVANAQYYLGEQTELSITLPTENITAGMSIYVNFENGESPTTLSITGDVAGNDYVPKANTVGEIDLLYNGYRWVMKYTETDIS